MLKGVLTLELDEVVRVLFDVSSSPYSSTLT